MRVGKWNTLVWQLVPTFSLYENCLELNWMRYYISIGGFHYGAKKLFEGFFILRRNTYFNELIIGFNKWHWKVFSKRNNPPRWDK